MILRKIDRCVIVDNLIDQANEKQIGMDSYKKLPTLNKKELINQKNSYKEGNKQ